LPGWPSPSALPADTGVLIPGDRQQPDPAVFSLDEMALEILIDNGVARVRVRQIFGNHSAAIQEGVYEFALPDKATVSDFAVWDDVTRIPGVILERRRAGEIYEQAKAQAIDPGLLQMGERTAGENGAPVRPSQEFTARIVPIPRVRHQTDRDGIPAPGCRGAVSIRAGGSAEARCLWRPDRRASHDHPRTQIRARHPDFRGDGQDVSLCGYANAVPTW
jgi:hypothetical protein